MPIKRWSRDRGDRYNLEKKASGFGILEFWSSGERLAYIEGMLSAVVQYSKNFDLFARHRHGCQ